MNEEIDKLHISLINKGSAVEYRIDLDKILYLESQGNRTIIHKEREEHIDGTEIVVAKTLLHFEEKLVGKPFLRIHNSFIINAQKLAKYNKGTKKFVTLVNGKEIDVSRGRKDILEGNNKIEKHPVPAYDEVIYVDLKSILYLEAHHDRTEFHLIIMVEGKPSKTSIFSTKNIGFFEKSLVNKPFFRIHDSYIVNLSKVVKYYRGSSSGYAVLNTGDGLAVSMGKKDAFLQYFRR